jgi:sirohydrochlorin cobaltochelatase
MRQVIVLAMHGVPPNDFPPREIAEFFSLHGRLEHGGDGAEHEALRQRHDELDAKIRHWPRTPQNDPFHAGSLELAEHLQRATGQTVIVGFNEFCAPDLDSALDQAAALSPDQVVVITPMMTRGGEHSESDIPAAVQRARQRHSNLRIDYAWPFESGEVARFLADQIARLGER